MTIKELKELRSEKLKAMETLVEKRSDNMDAETLAAVKEFKAEILEIDNKVEAIEEVRSIATKEAQPKEVKMENKKELRKENFNKYLRGSIDEKELRAMNIVDGTGGDTVPDEFLRTLLETVEEYGMFGKSAYKIQTANHGEMTIPAIDDTANSGAWIGEGASIPKADAATSKFTMNAYKVGTSVVVSTELLEDSAFDIAGYVSRQLGIRISRTLESAYISGDGSSKPRGVLLDAADLASGSVGTIVMQDFIDMIFAIQPSSRNGAKFYVSDEVLKFLTEQVDADGRPLLQASASATQANGIQYSLYGYPVEVNYELGSIATGENPVVFGNPKTYAIREVRNLVIKRSDELLMETDEVIYTATMRQDGKIISANDSFVKLTIA